MRIAQLANFVGPASGGMRTALRALGSGYVAAGCQRLIVVPGPEDARTTTPLGDVVQLRAPRVGGGYRLIVEPWRVVDVLEQWRPTSVELSDKLTLLPVARWAGRNGVGSVLLSHERLDDMLALRTGLDTTSKVSVGLLNRLLVRSVDTVVVTSDYARREFQQVADAAACTVVRVASRSASTSRRSAPGPVPRATCCVSCTPVASPVRRAPTSPSRPRSSCTAAACPCGWTSTASGRTSTSSSRSRATHLSGSTATSTPPPGSAGRSHARTSP